MANRWGNNGNNDDLVLNLKSVALKTKIMASGPVSSWQIDGETMETMMI